MKVFLYWTIDFLKPLLSTPAAHFQALVDTLDPVLLLTAKVDDTKKSNKVHYIFPCFAILLTYLYGIFGLHYEATGK